MESKRQLTGLYAITDTALTPEQSLCEQVSLALNGGAQIIQLRDKVHGKRHLCRLAARIKEICENAGAILIINDRVDVTLAVDAHGVHLGKNDMDPIEARRLLGNRIIGVSCYGNMDLAIAMEKAGADYVAFGAIFPSPTKPEAPTIGCDIIKNASAILSIPICAIGGITAENAGAVIEAGADMVATISDLWTASSISERASAYRKIFSSSHLASNNHAKMLVDHL